MLKKSASGVLASLRGSTYRSVRLASSLATALLDGHFEHPAALTPSNPFNKIPVMFHVYTEFFRSLLNHTWSDILPCHARLLQITIPDAAYHLMSRGNTQGLVGSSYGRRVP